MILRILVVLLICIIVILVGFWLLTGGLSRGIATARSLDNPFSFLTSTTTGLAIRLPWQPSEPLSGIEISDTEGTASAEEHLRDLQSQYEDLRNKAGDAKTFGNPSPYRGKIAFGSYATQEDNPNAEYVILRTGHNSAPISLAGWSLQSAVSGIRMSLPQAAPVFMSGVLNSVTAVSVDSDSMATITSGLSPVGISFRENRCSGYLAELQAFTPDLSQSCPRAQDELTLTPENIQTYGDACLDYVRTIPQCHFPGRDPAPQVSSACKNLVLNRFSYNGCVFAHRVDNDFALPSWRLYLSSDVELWRNSHDIIRLLDDQGRTVDVLTY